MLSLKKPKVLFCTAHSRAKPLHWTQHSRAKMRFYGLSEQRVRRIIHSPKRIEEGIAPKTIAMMQPNAIKIGPVKSPNGDHGASKQEVWTQELWVMIKDEPSRRKIISAWRYPGMTKPGEPLPPEILRELRAFI